jgi:hypothetical protein
MCIRVKKSTALPEPVSKRILPDETGSRQLVPLKFGDSIFPLQNTFGNSIFPLQSTRILQAELARQNEVGPFRFDLAPM